MGLRLSRVDGVTLGVFALTATFTSAVYAQLPEAMATHFDAEGNPNGWMPRALGAWFGLGLGGFAWLLVRFSGYLMPAEKRKQLDGAPLAALGLLLVAFLSVVQGLLLWVALTPGANLTSGLMVALGGLCVGMGLLLPRFPPNPLVGVRTRAAMSSPEVWAKTTKLAGRLFIAAGFGSVLAGLVGGPVALVGTFVGMVAASFVPAIYASVLARRS